MQKRLSIYNWNPGPRRGKEDAFEKQIASKWHVITLQEAVEYVDHDILTNRFRVTHYGGCAILFNKDTFYPNIEVKSLETRVGFCNVPHFVYLLSAARKLLQFSLHINNIYAKKKVKQLWFLQPSDSDRYGKVRIHSASPSHTKL